jgi:hypothetical protein
LGGTWLCCPLILLQQFKIEMSMETQAAGVAVTVQGQFKQLGL